MRKAMPCVLLTFTLYFCASCASVQLVIHSEPSAPPYLEQLKNKSISIVPFEISFGASRFALDLRGVTVTTGGQSFKLQTRYIAKDKDQRLGEIGVLDVDILTKAKADKQMLQKAITTILMTGLGGKHDYHIGFFKGLGEDNMGELSNRPIDYDRSVYPPAVVFKPEEPPSVIYSEIQVLPPNTAVQDAGTDLVLTGDVSISSEVVEVLAVTDEVAQRHGMGPDDRAPQPGEYYLTLLGSIRFKIVDAKTGAVIASESSKREWPVADTIADSILIPVQKSDADAYATYFRNVDFSGIAADAVRHVLPSVLPLMTTFYVNTSHQVKTEGK